MTIICLKKRKTVVVGKDMWKTEAWFTAGEVEDCAVVMGNNMEVAQKINHETTI